MHQSLYTFSLAKYFEKRVQKNSYYFSSQTTFNFSHLVNIIAFQTFTSFNDEPASQPPQVKFIIQQDKNPREAMVQVPT
jgi:hypothetical protein